MYDKQKNLWDQKIGSEVQYLQSKTTKESLEQQISSLKEQIGKFRIKSPITGAIEECNIKVGGVVSPDPRSAVYRVVAFNNLRVSAEVSEAYSSRVQTGDKVVLLFPDIKKQIETKVDFVSKYINTYKPHLYNGNRNTGRNNRTESQYDSSCPDKRLPF